MSAPYSGPFYGPSDPEARGPDRGPYIIALKRGLSRWSGGVELPWQQFNATYNLALEKAVAAFKKHKGLETEKYVWGLKAHNELLTALRQKGAYKPEELALDRTAMILMEDAYDLKFPGVRNLKVVRKAIAEYLEEMEKYNRIWHYLQQRPIGSLGDPPPRGGSDDCSALVIAACYWARLRTQVRVPDPTNYGYEGYGNSVSLYFVNRARKLATSGVFEVADVATYGPWASRHVTMCRKRGTAETSIWTSHGSEAGPYPCRLYYRGDLFAVVRPVLVP